MADLPSPSYTEATVELAVKAINHWHEQWNGEPDPNRMAAVAVLNALVKAGLLLPEGAETRTEYGVERTYPGLSPVVIAYPSRQEAERVVGAIAHFPRLPLMERATWSTPWRVVSDAEGGGVADQSKDPR